MTLKQFLQDKRLEAVEIVDYNGIQVINVYADGVGYGLQVDTSNIPAFTPLTYTTDFILDGTQLSVSGITVDTSTVSML